MQNARFDVLPLELENLRDAVRARDELIGSLGHELRNSIAPLVLLAEQFELGLGLEPSQLASRTAMLARNVRKLASTIDRVSEVAQLRDGKLQLSISRVDLGEVVRDARAQLEREADAGGVELRCVADPAVVGLWDRARVKQIVTNLLSNAIRYGGPGTVTITVRAAGDRGELAVEDQGPGIPEAERAHLFERLDHAARARRHNGGFGLGLWIAKTLCRAMNGSIALDPTVGSGARFSVSLPRG